jgi:diguanylate cyclase (GGDEF)-like protein
MVVEEGFAKPYDHMFKQLYDNSIRDQLTGLYNRRYYEKSISEELKSVIPLSLVFMDINGLKLINDAFGHADGDNVILWFAKAMQDKCRSTDRLIRIGGDEFMILIPASGHTSLQEYPCLQHSAVRRGMCMELVGTNCLNVLKPICTGKSFRLAQR